MTWTRRALLAVAVIALVGATPRVASATAPSESAPARPSVGAPCRTPTKFTPGANEVRGTARSGTLFGLFLGEHVPPRAGDQVKIVWRMTGTGPLHVRLTAPDGTRHPLTFGPTAHGASTYQRPGDEWGTGFRLDDSGCWHLRLVRADNAADVWLDVRPAAVAPTRPRVGSQRSFER